VIEFAHPAALAALALPLAVLLGARAFDRPASIATGTLELWDRVESAPPAPSPRARVRIPPAVWALAAALALGALALAGPRTPPPRHEARLRVLLDRSASMELPLGRATRRARATELARAWLAEHAPGTRDDAWIDHPGAFGADDDRADTLWVTDRAPDPPPRHAGFVASGGPAVPGPITVDGATRYDWDGERIVEVKDGAPARRVEVTGALPEPIAGVLAAWAAGRGATIGAGAARPALLVSGRDQNSATGADVAFGRDGWTARGKLGAAAPAPALAPALAAGETWLADARGTAIVTSSPGRIDCALATMEDPSGDPAAFAVSWAALLDRAVLAPEGVVPLAGRVAAGDEKIAAPRGAADDVAAPASAWDAWLAGGALACVVLALLLARSVRIG